MEGGNGFQEEFEAALLARRDYLDKNVLPRLKEQFRIYHVAFQGFYNVLLRKGLIHEDPYKNEQKISEVTVPPSGPFMDSEKIDQISIRLSMLDSELDFLNNYYQFSADFLTLERIKQLSGLATYILWGKVSESSTNINTRIIAEMVGKIRQGADALSLGIINDAENQMERCTKEIIAILKQLTEYQREAYKRDVRERLLFKLNLNAEMVMNRRDDTLKAVRQRFSQEMSGSPFYAELVEEVIDEDYSPGSEQLRKNVLSRLAVKEEKPKKKVSQSYASILLDAVKILSGSAVHIEQAMRKLTENSIILSQRKLTLGERFRRWLFNLTKKNDSPNIYEIEFFDVATSATRTEKLDFTAFKEKTAKRVRLLYSLANRMSTTYRRLESTPEDKMYEFLQGLIKDVQEILHILPALDTFFKSEVGREDRARVKGIKLEITAIKNCLIKCNQKKHEYVSRKEEEEQLKKLGIDTNVE